MNIKGKYGIPNLSHLSKISHENELLSSESAPRGKTSVKTRSLQYNGMNLGSSTFLGNRAGFCNKLVNTLYRSTRSDADHRSSRVGYFICLRMGVHVTLVEFWRCLHFNHGSAVC